MATWKIEQTELIEWLSKYDGPRFHAIVSDPPYALISIAKRFGRKNSAPAQEGSDGRFSRLSGGFMGQKWDGFESLDQYREWVEEWAKLLIEKALEPGAVCLFFGGTRTWHHLALGLEQGGFEVYDTMMWLHGSGFPKSHRIGCECEEAEQKTEREVRHLPETDLSTTVQSGQEQGQEILLDSLSQQNRLGIQNTERDSATGSRIKGSDELRMEGRDNLPEKSRESQGSQIHSLSIGIQVDGEERRLRNGTQISHGQDDGKIVDEGRSSPSQESRFIGQSARESTMVSEQHGTQESRGICETCGKVKGWSGFGTALKPAFEPILLCRAPRGKHTFAELATEHGSGALNIDGARISHNEPEEVMVPRSAQYGKTVYANAQPSEDREGESLASPSPLGRWPANLILSHHEDCQRIEGGETEIPARVINRFKSGMKPFGNAAGEDYETVKPTKARLPDGSANPDYKRPDEESPWKMPPGKRRPTKVRVKASGGTAAHSERGGVYGDGEGIPPIERKNFADEEGYELIDRWACVPECPVRQLDDQVGDLGETLRPNRVAGQEVMPGMFGLTRLGETHPGIGGPSRFFYTGKATRGEKDIGLEDFYWKRTEDGFERVSKAQYDKLPRHERAHANIHPTVKPLEIVRYLATLVLPPKQEGRIRRILVPFSGSGSEVIGAIQAGWDEALGIEMEAKYNEMAEARMRATLGMF